MQQPSPFPSSYLKYALADQHNVVALCGGACFSAAFATPAPLLLTAAGELAWLVAAPRLGAFRAWVDRRLSAEYLERAERAIEGALKELPEFAVNRFLALTAKLRAFTAAAAGHVSPRELQLGEHALLELRRTFLDYLFLDQRLRSLIDPAPIATFEAESARLQDAYRSERDLIQRMTIRNTLNGLQKKIGEQTGLAGVAKAVSVRLRKLEEAVPSAPERDTEQLAPGILGSLAAIGSADALERAVDQIVDGVAG